jgi:hypothetical protein
MGDLELGGAKKPKKERKKKAAALMAAGPKNLNVIKTQNKLIGEIEIKNNALYDEDEQMEIVDPNEFRDVELDLAGPKK